MPVAFRGGSWKLRLKNLLWSGEAVDRQGFWREREAACRAELSLDPSLKHIWVQYGHALKEQGRLDAAEEAYRRSLALDATFADTNLQLGHLLKLQGRTADAADAYLIAHRLDPGLADPHRELLALGLDMPPPPRGKSEFDADPEFIEAAYGTSPEPAAGRYASTEHALRAHALTAGVLNIFDFRYYFYANAAVRNAAGKLNRHRCLLHFCTHGISNVLQCNGDLVFDAAFYCDAYLPWRLSGSNAYWHWLNVGSDKGWHPSRINWLKHKLGSDLAARASIDFAPCRTFFYTDDLGAKSADLFDRFLDAEVLCPGPHLLVTPETADFFVAVADRFVGVNDDDAAISLYERVLLSMPNHRHALLNYADCLLRKRLFLPVAAIHAGIIERNEASLWCFLHQAACHEELGDSRKALTCLQSGIDRFPGEFRFERWFDDLADRFLVREWRLAFAIGKLGRYSEAQSRMQKALEFVSSKMTVAEGLPHKPIRSVAIVGILDIPQCYFYRVEQKAEHLEAAGYDVFVYNVHSQLNDFISEIYKYEAVIFYRAMATIPVLGAIEKSREMGLVTFYDMDDLLFVDDYPGTPERFLGQFTTEDYVGLKLDVPSYRHAISLCDYGMAPTSALADEMAKIVTSGRAFVHRNGFGREHERLSLAAPAVRAGKPITIFYGCGTKSHKEEFRDLVEPALVEIVARYGSRVHIVLAGYTVTSDAGRIWYVDGVIPSEALESIRQNVTLIGPIWDIDEYWSILKTCDINLAVLKKSAMSDCKSEIKWMEAAMFGIPSVVSGTMTHEEVIEPGVTGLICNTPEEWIAALDLLVGDEALRRRIGFAARQRVHDTYNILRMSENLASIFEQTAPETKSPPKPIIVIVNTFYRPQAGGEATRIVGDSVRYLTEAYKDDFQIEVFTTTPWTAQDYEVRCYAHEGVRVTAVHCPVSPEIAQTEQDARMEELFAEYLDRVDPALIHFHDIQRLTASVVSAALARGIPYVITANKGWWISDLPLIVNEADEQVLYDYSDPVATTRKWGAAAHRRMMQLQAPLFGASKILVAGDKSADLHRNCGIPNVVTLANGVSDIQKKPRTASPDSRVRLGFLGGIEDARGLDIIRYALLSREFEHLRLTIIDAGLDPGSSRQKVWNTTPIEFISEVPDDRLAELYANIDVLLAPSVWPETFGLVACEALLCGCWVVASDRGSVGDCVVPGENGYVIDVSDAMELIGVLGLMDATPQRYLEAPSARPVFRRSSEQGDELAGLYKSIIAAQSTNPPAASRGGASMAGAAAPGRARLG